MESVSVSTNGYNSLIGHHLGQTSLIAKSRSTQYYVLFVRLVHGGKKHSPTFTGDFFIIKHGPPYLAHCPFGKETRKNSAVNPPLSTSQD
jgi:hypothetical protein